MFFFSAINISYKSYKSCHDIRNKIFIIILVSNETSSQNFASQLFSRFVIHRIATVSKLRSSKRKILSMSLSLKSVLHRQLSYGTTNNKSRLNLQSASGEPGAVFAPRSLIRFKYTI